MSDRSNSAAYSTVNWREEDLKIYLAARIYNNRFDTDINNPHQAVAATEPFPNNLESFHYIKSGKWDDDMRRFGHSIFLDSGAFSAFTLGAKIDLDEYADFMRERTDLIHVASNVDEIGAGKELESYNNQKYLESLATGVKISPVHHARDDDSWLVKYLDEGYDWIFLGGMVNETTGFLYDWLDHVWDKYLALPDGTARVKIHGFGLTTFELMDRYPWYSVDSTSWLQMSAFGNILFRVGNSVKTLSMSNSGPNVKTADRSYWSMDAVTRAHVDKVLLAEGFKPEDLAESYGWRDKWNIRFYREYMKGLRPTFERKQVTFF